MVYPQQPPPGEFPGEYPPEYYNGGYGPRPWMPRVHTGFRYFLLLLIILLVVGYFTGSNPLQPVTNVINPAQPTAVTTPSQVNQQNDFDNNPVTPNNTVSGSANRTPMTVTTTVAPNTQTPNAYTGVPVPAQNSIDPQTEMSIRQSQAAADANFDARAHRLKAIRASNTPTVPDGWYTWSVEKRARYVRALMDRIDAP